MSKQSLSYYRFFDTINNRLDENFNNPKFDELDLILSKTKFEIIPIGDPKIKQLIISGKTPKNLKQDENLDIPFIGGTSIYDEKVDLSIAPRISREVHETVLKSSQIKKGYILITMAGVGIGRCAVFETDDECNANQAIAILRINEEKIIPKFLLKYLHSKIGQFYLEKLQHIAGQPNINLEEIQTINIIVPDKENYQKIILAKLKTVDEKAKQKEHEAELELDKIEELFSDILGISIEHNWIQNYACFFNDSLERLDFIFNDPFYLEYEKLMKNSKIPFIELDALVEFPIENTNPLKRPDESFLYVDIGNIDTKWGVANFESMMGSEAISSRMRKVIHKGEVLVSTTRPTRRAIAIVPDLLDGQVCSTGFAALKCKEGVNNEYLFHILRSKITTEQFLKYSTGSGYPELSKDKDLPKIKIPIPDKVETQIEIVNKINSIIEKARKLHDESLCERKKAQTMFDEFIQN